MKGDVKLTHFLLDQEGYKSNSFSVTRAVASSRAKLLKVGSGAAESSLLGGGGCGMTRAFSSRKLAKLVTTAT